MRAVTSTTGYTAVAMIGAFLFGVFLMVDDELFTYMTRGIPLYDFPILGNFGLWDAWALDFGFIVVSVGIMLVGVYKSR
jgi:hypothetical protein